MRAGALVLAAVCLACACGADTEAPPVRVAAAADLTDAFEAVGRAFTARTGHAVTFSFGSTGMLAAQIREGAPFDVFAAANVSFVDAVVAAGVCDGATKTPYARGRIAIWSRRSGVAPARTLADLADARFARVAIANPAHAPYGIAARDALVRAGVYETVAPRLVLGENVRQTLQFAQTGNVEAAIVALALVVNDRDDPWVVIAEDAHAPIDQALVVCRRGDRREGGDAFARFVASEEGRVIMRRYGFLLPGETLMGSR